MRRLIILLALAGCASQTPVEVKVPVQVPCVTKKPDRPSVTFGQGEYPGGTQAMHAIFTDYIKLDNYAIELEVIIAGCASK